MACPTALGRPEANMLQHQLFRANMLEHQLIRCTRLLFCKRTCSNTSLCGKRDCSLACPSPFWDERLRACSVKPFLGRASARLQRFARTACPVPGHGMTEASSCHVSHDEDRFPQIPRPCRRCEWLCLRVRVRRPLRCLSVSATFASSTTPSQVRCLPIAKVPLQAVRLRHAVRPVSAETALPVRLSQDMGLL